MKKLFRSWAFNVVSFLMVLIGATLTETNRDSVGLGGNLIGLGLMTFGVVYMAMSLAESLFCWIWRRELAKPSPKDASRTNEAGYLALTAAQPSRSQPITSLRLRPRIGSLVRFQICGCEAKGIVARMTGQGRFGRATISNCGSRGADRIVRRIRDLSLVSFN